MKLPSAQEYLQIIEKKDPAGLGMLYGHRFLKDGDTYVHIRGKDSIIFKTEHNSKLYAVRFFLFDDAELFQRYPLVQQYLNTKMPPWLVSFEFMDKGFYPVIRMPWVESLSFSEYLDLIITDRALLSQLQSGLVALSKNLEDNLIGHGDLNPNHIRFVKQGSSYVLKLIDYDSVYVPALREKDSLTVGSANFQHPMRLASDFSETIDRFSVWVLLTALEAFKTDPSLWTNSQQFGYDKSKQVLFSFNDFAYPQESNIIQILKNYNNESLDFYVEKLIELCNNRWVTDIEFPKLYSLPEYASRKKYRAAAGVSIVTEEGGPRSEAQPSKQASLPAYSKAVAHQGTTVRDVPGERSYGRIRIKEPVRSTRQNAWGSGQKTTHLRNVVIIAVVSVVALLSIYFLSAQKKSDTIVADENQPATNQSLQNQGSAAKEEIFNSGRVTQFLSQLYESYNKRNLQGILSNYSDTVTPYYEVGAVTKSKLTGIIQDLFIKPAYYNCTPDLTKIEMNTQTDICLVTVPVRETLQANKNSDRETYPSRIQYTINKSFKITGEKNLE